MQRTIKLVDFGLSLHTDAEVRRVAVAVRPLRAIHSTPERRQPLSSAFVK
jgi:hypothetical protein